MADLSDSNSTSTNDNSLVEIRASDNTVIGNNGDRLKVDAQLTSNPNTNLGQFTLADSNQLDAFGRFRASIPQSLFGKTFIVNKSPLNFSESRTGSATITHDSSKSSVNLTTTTASGDKAIFQTKRYFNYYPGRSQLIMISGNLGGNKTNVRRRVGYFDTNNGLFFELASSTLSVVSRSSVTGSPIDSTINQSSWNLDKLDGTGSSGITLDVSKQLIFVIDFQWLGSGRVRFGFNIDGKIIYCHEMLNANILDVPYSGSSLSPIRVEIENTGTAASSTTLRLTCVTVNAEGANQPEGVVQSVNTGTTLQVVLAATRFPIISLRKQSSYSNITIHITDVSVFPSTADDLLVELVINPTLTGASWANAGTIAQKDISATLATGGTTIYSTYIRGSAGGTVLIIPREVFEIANSYLGSDLSGTSDIFSLVVTSLTGLSSLAGSITFREHI